MSKTVGIYLDSNNLYHNTREVFPKRRINYPAIYNKFITDTGDIAFDLNVYGIQKTKKEANKFIQKLHYEGFTCFFDTFPKISKSWTLRKELKNAWDCGITVDIMRAVLNGKVDKVVLGTNSHSMNKLIREINKQVEVVVIAPNISNYTKGICECIEIDESLLL